MRIGRLLAALLTLMALSGAAWAGPFGDQPAGMHGMPAWPGIIEKRQPDGTVFQARQFGGPWYHWTETVEGYVIEQNRATGFYEYVQVNKNGRFELTGLVVGKIDPAAKGLTKKAQESLEVIQARLKMHKMVQTVAVNRQGFYPSTGTVKMLVLLALLNGETTQTAPADFDLLFNDTSTTGGPSVAKYYAEVSYGKVQIQATVIGWIPVPGGTGYYDENGMDPQWTPQLVKDCIDIMALSGFVDWAQFDLDGDGILEPVCVIHTGEGEEFTGNPADIWSHQWVVDPMGGQPYPVDSATTSPGTAGYSVFEYFTVPEMMMGQQTTIGVIVHEMGHGFGLPDLYDTTYASEGIGEWCLMAGGGWLGPQGLGESPAHMSAWIKQTMGWLDITTASGRVILDAVPNLALPNSEFTPNSIYRIHMGTDPTTSPEYLLIENRFTTGFDAYLPGEGLLVWHVDEQVPDNDTSPFYPHHMVVLIQADNQWDLEARRNRGDPGDPFPGAFDVPAIGPYWARELNYFQPDSNSYYSGDTNIWIENISPSSVTMSMSVRFLPNYWFDPATDITLDPPRGYVTFRKGTRRNFFTTGQFFHYDVGLMNQDDNYPFAPLCETAGPTLVELWSADMSGLRPRAPLMLPIEINPGLPGNSWNLFMGSSPIPLLSAGGSQVAATVDRYNTVRESAEPDNRWISRQIDMLILPEAAEDVDLEVQNFQFATNWARAGEPIDLRGRIVNKGTTTSKFFWIEFWASTNWPGKDYPTLDFMVTDSILVPSLGPGESVDLSTYARTFYAAPDHDMMMTFDVGCLADRPNTLYEKDKTNNYQFAGPVYFSTLPALGPVPIAANEADAAAATVAPAPDPSLGLRRAQLEQPELTVTFSTVTLSGQAPPDYLMLHLTVQNWGLTSAPASWNHVYLSRDLAYSPDDYLWVPGLWTPALPPGASHTLRVPVALPALPLGAYQMFTQCDVINEVAEAFETNNISYAGPVINGVDLVFQSFDYIEQQPGFIPESGLPFIEPATSITLHSFVTNRGILPSAPFWIEYWASHTGGLTLDEYVCVSDPVGGVGALSTVEVTRHRPLLSIADGLYTFVAVVDRLRQAPEVNESNNRHPVRTRPMLHVRPVRPVNLKVPFFRFAPDAVYGGHVIKFNGSIVNDGREHSGPFWIEFYGTSNWQLPTPEYMICDAIYVDNLRPGQQLFLQPYMRSLYHNLPKGITSIICIVDVENRIQEMDETDNYYISPRIDLR